MNDDEDYPEAQDTEHYIVGARVPAPFVRTERMSVSSCEAVAKPSPRPWRLEVGRLKQMRLDIVDANGKLVCHFHPTEPRSERMANWEQDAQLIIDAVNRGNS